MAAAAKAEADVEMKSAEEASKEAPEGTAKAEGDAEAKDDGKQEAKTEEAPKEPEKPKEAEGDAAPDSRERLPAPVGFNTEDTTLNAVPSAGGKLLMALQEGGLQYLLAGARSNVGLKAGRYMFEAVVLGERPAGPQQGQQRGPQQTVRLGFAAAGASLLLADGEDSVCFDSDGFFLHGKVKKRVSQKFGADQAVAVLLNLDAGSPNASSVSLFRGGVRVAEPQPLPEGLRGRALFPAVSFRGTALRLNFAEPPLRTLPFRCRMVQDAATADCEIAAAASPGSGKHEVVVPVALPDEGCFDWVDQFLAKNPQHFELSSRAIIDWAVKSGVWRKTTGKGCNDRPETGFGVQQLDDLSVPRLLAAIAPALPRSYIVPEVKGNLLAESRKVLLERFAGFRRTAVVLVGEPGEGFKQGVHAALLQEKQAKAEAEARRRKVEAERKRQLEAKRQKAKAPKEEDGEKKEEEKGEAEEEKAEPQEEEQPIVELTEEEKKVPFRKRPLTDLLATDLAKNFTKFTLPEDGEGFDEVRYEWQAATGAAEHLRSWVLKRKATQRVEDLQPSKWFKDIWAEWQKLLLDWKKKQTEWKKVIDQLQEWKKEGTKKTPEEDKKESDDKPTELDTEDIDVFKVENICDISNGEPLFANFEYEDWCLLSLRYELHLLLHAFRRDMDDPERTTFHDSHLSFYYNRYFKKALDLKLYCISSNMELLDLVKDAAVINATSGMVEGLLAEDSPMDNFVKLTEEHRRDRQRRLDAGDESAELKFAKPAPAQPARGQPGQWQKAPRGPQYAPAQKVAPPAGGQKVPQPPRYAPTTRPAGAAVAPVASRGQFQAAPRAAAAGQPARSPQQVPARMAPQVVPAQKRPFTPAPKAGVQPPAKQVRTSYGSQGGGRW